MKYKKSQTEKNIFMKKFYIFPFLRNIFSKKQYMGLIFLKTTIYCMRFEATAVKSGEIPGLSRNRDCILHKSEPALQIIKIRLCAQHKGFFNKKMHTDCLSVFCRCRKNFRQIVRQFIRHLSSSVTFELKIIRQIFFYVD